MGQGLQFIIINHAMLSDSLTTCKYYFDLNLKTKGKKSKLIVQ